MTIIQHFLLLSRIAGRAIARGYFAFTYFWNIPALGEVEPSEGLRTRTIRRI
jgi:hypothetical protein